MQHELRPMWYIESSYVYGLQLTQLLQDLLPLLGFQQPTTFFRLPPLDLRAVALGPPHTIEKYRRQVKCKLSCTKAVTL